MKKATIFFLLLVFLFQLQDLQAQFIPRNIIEAIDMLDLRALTTKLDVEQVGSPYFNDKFIKGEIYYNNQWVYQDILLRYNIYTDEIEFFHQEINLAYTLAPALLFNKILIGNDTFIVAKYNKGKENVPGFFKVLTSGKATLLMKMEVDYTEVNPGTSFLRAEPAKFEFIRKPDKYFLQYPEKDAVRIKKIKKLITLLGEHQNELREYKKQEGVSTRNESELVQFISYFNSL